MTREETLALPAGRELDALVAVHVFGWGHAIVEQVRAEPDFFGAFALGSTLLPHYSSVMDDAWLIVRKLTVGRHGFALNCWPEGGLVFAKFTECYREWVAEAPHGCEALAICRAALLAAFALENPHAS